MKNLKTYSNEELKKLYKSYTLYLTTEYFKYLRRKPTNSKTIAILDTDQEEKMTAWDDQSVYLSVKIENISNKILKAEDQEVIKELSSEKQVLKTLKEVLFWCAGGFTHITQLYKSGANVSDPEELYDELHFNDDLDIQFGRPTKFDIYLFIWETLRHCTVAELNKLLKYADRKFEFGKAGRKSNNHKIIKLDQDGNIVAEYANRNECLEYENISKGSLSNVLSGKRETLNGFYFNELINE